MALDEGTGEGVLGSEGQLGIVDVDGIRVPLEPEGGADGRRERRQVVGEQDHLDRRLEAEVRRLAVGRLELRNRRDAAAQPVGDAHLGERLGERHAGRRFGRGMGP